MKNLLRSTAISSLFVLAACATTAPEGPSITAWPDGAAESAERFKHDLTTLAGDDYEGREAGTPGYDKAVDYVVAAFQEIGLKPAGEDGYLQQVPLRRAFALPEEAMVTIMGADGEVTLTPFTDFTPSAARKTAHAEASGEVVFVGYGIDAPEFDYTPYADVDVKGKIVVVIGGTPDGLPSEERAHLRSWSTKRQTAVHHGAIGMITLRNFEVDDKMRGRMMQSFARPANIVNYPAEVMTRMDAVANMTRSGTEKLFAGTDIDLDEMFEGKVAAQDLAVTVSISTKTRFEGYTSPNVIGMIKGSDRSLRSEYVVLTAHLDHIGVRKSVEEGVDNINNGAMDNASGTATLLEEARKFMADGEKPRRSILFVALTAEEKGLLGSEYFANVSTVKTSSMVANVNLDMPILMHDFTDVIAFGAAHSTLKQTATRAGASMGVKLTPDPVPNMALFVRSDHYNFVKVGVPSIFLFLGFESGGEEKFKDFMATNYHRPGDQSDQGILWDVAAKFAELNFRIAKDIANADEKPTWNEGDFFGEAFAPDMGM